MDSIDINTSKLSSFIITQFDEKFQYIVNGNKKIPFSAEKILTDLISSGISTYDALDILFKSQSSFKIGLTLAEITKILNQVILEFGYGEAQLIRGQFDPLIVEYEDYEELLTLKRIKEFVADQLKDWNYSTSTYKRITEEYYRVLRSIRTNRFKSDNIMAILKSVIRSIIELDPFNSDIIHQHYHQALQDHKELSDQMDFMTQVEVKSTVLELSEQCFELILLSFKYLPGYNFSSTISQIGSLVHDIHQTLVDHLEEKELIKLGRIANQVHKVHLDSSNSIFLDAKWNTKLKWLMNFTTRRMHYKVIKWMVLIDQHKRELFSKFSKESQRKHRSLIGMAFGGIQSLVNEVTDDKIQVIQQEDGFILIETTPLFSVFIFIKGQATDAIKVSIKKFANNVLDHGYDEIINFNGNIDSIRTVVTPILEETLGYMF